MTEQVTVEEARAGEAAEADALDLSVVIVTWNSGPWIERCLQSLPAAIGDLSWEAVVVDNASADDTVSRVDRQGGDVRLILNDANEGFAAAVNQALETTRGRYTLLLNPDSVPAVRSITKLVSHLDREPEIAGAAPLLLGEDGVPQAAFQLRRLPTLRTLIAEILLLNRLFPRNRLHAHHPYSRIDLDGDVVEIEQPAAAALLLRSEIIRSVGPLDERFTPAWFEDVDYCRRLLDRGERLVLIPEARVVHRGAASLDTMGLEAFLPIWYRNLYLYARKWMSPISSGFVRWMIVAGMILRIGALIIGLNTMSLERGAALKTHRRVLREAIRGWKSSS